MESATGNKKEARKNTDIVLSVFKFDVHQIACAMRNMSSGKVEVMTTIVIFYRCPEPPKHIILRKYGLDEGGKIAPSGTGA